MSQAAQREAAIAETFGSVAKRVRAAGKAQGKSESQIAGEIAHEAKRVRTMAHKKRRRTRKGVSRSFIGPLQKHEARKPRARRKKKVARGFIGPLPKGMARSKRGRSAGYCSKCKGKHVYKHGKG